MNLNAQINVGALFKLIAHKGDGVPTKETGWFHNLVLDTGLKQLSVGTAISHCFVGTGNSEPKPEQTGLDSHLAETTQVLRTEQGRDVKSAEPFYWIRKVYRYNEGAAKGNLAEVGTGWVHGSCFNRTLIKDDLGNPTTITILEDEFLDVVVEFRVYPQKSFTKELKLKNKLGAVVSTHTLKGSCIIGQDPYQSHASLGKVYLGSPSSGYSGLVVYKDSAHLEDITTTCTGAQFQVGGNNTYPTPTSCKWTGRVELGVGNDWAHKAFQIGVSYLCSWQAEHAIGYKWEIDPPIPKNNNQVLQYSLTVSWGRHEEAE